MNVTSYAQRVYAYHRDYAALHGYAPTGGEACHWLHMSSRHYYAALKWLAERRFLTHPPRLWRAVRLNVRVCACGVELTPENAVVDVNGDGYLFVRRACVTCVRQQRAERQRAWNAAHPGYYARYERRKHRSATA